MPNSVPVSVHRDDEPQRLVVPNRALGAARVSHHREHWVAALTALLMNGLITWVLVQGTALTELLWTSTGRQDADPAPAMAVEFLTPELVELPAAPVLTTDDPLVTWTVPPPGELLIAPPQIELTEVRPQPTPEVGAASPDEARVVPEAERLRGIYAGQIEGRIDRAWTRDDAWMEGIYLQRCSAKVEQSAEGQVQRVEFLDCPQLPDWKRNLESAIRRASPLPAPPERAVFASVIYLADK
ncbi:MAG: cell envelope integrity protein TolA [Steroidobacteraceae bacterium]